MTRHAFQSKKGSVLLVALCFVTVLGISLASYMAVCSRTMQVSNRTAQTSLSRQLAEMGLEEGLRAYNLGDWSNWTNGTAAAWTITGTTATCNLTFPAGTFGQGVTGSVKIRVDNYNANRLSATWNSSATYHIGDLVGNSGTWYRSVRNNNNNQTPSAGNLTWWVSSPMPWTWSSDRTYSQYEMVNYKGIWYRCITPPLVSAGTTTYAPAVPVPATTYWAPIPSQRAWAASTTYSVYDVVAYTDPTTSDVTLYRCITAHTSGASFSTDAAKWSSNVQTVSLAWSSGTVYTRGAITYYIGSGVTQWRWYYCIQSGTSNTAPSADTTMWAPVWPDTSAPAAPSNGTAYSVGNYISYLDNCYRCITAHTYSNWASSSGNWANIASDNISSGTQYYVGDYAVNNGTWYRCTTAHSYNNWATDSGKWTSTNAGPHLQLFYFGGNSLSTGSNSIFYYAGSNWYRYMGGYVLALTGNMHAWVSGNKYNLGDAVYYTSLAKWYRCILAHTSSGTITPSNTTYWATDPLFPTAWDSGKQYSANDTVRYNGVWYICILSHSNNPTIIPPTNTTYWIGANTSTTSYQWNISTAYATGAYKCYGGVWYKCLSANTGYSPNNTTYWTASWANSFGVTTGAPVVYAEGTVNIAGTASIKTQLRTTIAPASLFPNAVAANSSTITANSGGTVDSYDSTSGTVASQGGGTTIGGYSNLGTYAGQVNTSTNYSAVVASSYSVGTAITLSSTDVKGYLAAPSTASSPYAPQYSSGGTVKGFSSPGSPNIDLTRISRSPYIPKFATVPGGAGGLATNWSIAHKGTPISWTAAPASTTLNLGTPGATVPSRYNYNGSLTIGTATQNILRINGPVILYINGDFFITAAGSTGRVDIASTGSAEIHVAGRFIADVGGEGILSYTSDPKSLTIICDTTSTSTHFYSEDVNDFYGVIYIPYSTSTTGYYNDNNNTEIFGAVSANKITYSGANLNIHYDTSLRYATIGGVDQPYTITEWRELVDAVELATMP